MNWTSLSLRSNLLLIAFVTITVTSLVASVGYARVWGALNDIERTMAAEVANERDILVMVSTFKKQVQEWKNVLLRGADPGELDKYWQRFEQEEATLRTRGATLLTRLDDADARETIGRFLAAHEELGAAYRRGLQAYKDSGFVASVGDQALKGLDRKPTELLDHAAERMGTLAAAAMEENYGTIKSAVQIALVLLVAMAVVVLALFNWFAQHNIVRPAQRLVNEMNLLAQGDFSRRLEVQGKDELAQIAASAASIQERLGDVIRGVHRTTEELAAAAQQMTGNAAQTRARLTQQHAESEQLATAITEMTSSIQDVARGAAQTMDAAQAADLKAQDGGRVVHHTIEAVTQVAADLDEVGQVIGALEQRSENIGGVLDVINGIAEQTNLLALNAAIEAARAGEQGRGFAVVADEVRSLAQRTQSSTKEIQTIIAQLQDGARSSVRIVSQIRQTATGSVEQADRAGAALAAINDAVKRIADMSTQIASAAEQQGLVASEINRNVINISQATRETLDGAQQSTDISENLAQLSGELQTSVQGLRL